MPEIFMVDLISYPDFESTSRGVLAFLHQRLGFGLWMVTRTEGEDWIVLQAEDHGYGVRDGAVFRWADSFCSQMVQGLGPCIAPSSDRIPAYANAPIGRQVSIGAYVGVPLADSDGSLFGTLCAIDPNTMPESLHTELPLIELLGRMLSCLLVSEMKLASIHRKQALSKLNDHIDWVTGFLDVVGWDNVVSAEERRCQIYGSPAAVILLELAPNPNDSLNSQAEEFSSNLKNCFGTNDIGARLTSTLFAVLGADCNAQRGQILADRISETLKSAGFDFSVAVGNRDPRTGLQVAYEAAKSQL
jgi:diguanylate cyclase